MGHTQGGGCQEESDIVVCSCNETDSIIKESITLAKSKVRENPFKIACDCFDILGLWSQFTALSLLQRHKYLQDKIHSIEGEVARGRW